MSTDAAPVDSLRAGGRRRRPDAHPHLVAREVTKFVLTSLVVVIVTIGLGVPLLRDIGRREAIRDARAVAELAAKGVVEPNLQDAILERDAFAIERIDTVVQERILADNDQMVRVKIWSEDGRILYSDEERLIGREYTLGEDEKAVLTSGRVEAELVTDFSAGENVYEREEGDLLEVYTRIRTPNGTPVVFELYQRFDSVVASGRRVWLSFVPPLLAGLALLWMVQVPLAYRLARRVRDVHAEREELLRRALDASNDERRRIAGDLHDSVVQDLAGISYSLAAAADRAEPTDPELADTLREGAGGTRESMQRLRSLLVAIHPANLRASGIEAALRDLLAPLERRHIDTHLHVDDHLGTGAETESLLYRAAREAIRNVQEHAEATRVDVSVEREGPVVRLTITDNGRGFTAEELERRREVGHVGLSLLEELATHEGGELHVDSQPGAGTTFVLEVAA